MFKRICSLALVLAVLIGLLPAIAVPKANAAPSASSATVTSLFEARSEGVHPRIFANSDDFARIRKLVKTDPYMKTLYTRVYNYCTEILAEPLLVYEIPDGKRLLTVCNNATYRITWLAMAYQISGEARFADRAVQEMINVCGFKDWNPSHYLDTAQMSFGVGVGYDWLYHYMSDSQRKTIMNGIYNHGVSTQQETRSCMTAIHNWNPWCNGGLAVAAAAIFENHPIECAAILSNAVSNIQKSMLFAPSGAYPEGPDYSGVGLGFTVYLINTLETVLGTDFGLGEIEGMKESGNFLAATNGYLNTFNYGDGSYSLKNSATLHWYANRYNMPELSVYQREHQYNNSRYDAYLSMIWYNPELVEGVSAGDSQMDYFVKSDEYESIASFRSFPGDARQIYAAIKSGSNQTNHTDMDIGTFVMEAMGEAWFVEMGKDNYNLPNYMSRTNESSGRWTYYRKRAEGQNTIVINPGTYGGQAVDAKCQITDYQSAYDGGYAIVDMKDAYDLYGATSIRRSLALFDNRSRVRLRDEISCSSASTIYWFAHTQANISISSDGKTATLTQNGKTLLAQIASPDDAKFTKMNATPLSSSPNPSGQNANDGYRKLVIKLTNATKASITVFFTPILEESDKNKSLNTWGISNTGKMLNEYAPGTTLTPNSEGVYEIYDAEQLCLLSKMVSDGTNFSGKTVRLMADIDMKSRSFRPIGGNGTGTTFKGTFDGNNHAVKNLLIYELGGESVGFFGACSGATILNFGIESGAVFGGKAAAGLIGVGNSVTIRYCFNRAKVISNGNHCAGLVGQLGGTSQIYASYNNAPVKTSGSVAGGVAGYISSSSVIEINACYHTGTLTDAAGKTGMIGFYNTGSTNPITSITVKNCRSTASIKSSEIAANDALESYSGSGKWKASEMPAAAHGLGGSYIYDCAWINDGNPILTWQSTTELPENLVLTTAAQLRMVAFLVNSGKDNFSGKTIRLGRDIDLDSREWVPIGGNQSTDTGGKTFKGTFDGQGYSVSNLKISTGRYYVGFFGNLSGTVKNFGISSGSVKGANKASGLAGCAAGTISNCFSRATVNATGYAGGLVGMSGKTNIENSYAKADITTTGSAGGLVGYYASSAAGSKITNSYAACTLDGKNMGGLVCSINTAITDLTITNSYALSGPSLIYSTTGYTLKSSSSQSAANLKAKAETLGSAFSADGYTAENGGYPVLTVNNYKTSNMAALEPNAEGIYEIRTAQELRRLAYMVNKQGVSFAGKTVRLMADIDLENTEWIPIGGNASADGASSIRFSGTFDGNGHCVHNLAVSEGNYYVGFFGDAGNATIQNFGIESGIVTGQGKVGGIVGTIRSNVTITNCYNKANVSGRASYGGIVGMASGSNCTVDSCYNAGSIGSSGSSGGIVGYYSGSAVNTVIQNCYNWGKAAYGIVGSASTSATGAVNNCYTIDTAEAVGTPSALVLTNTNKLSATDLRASVATLGEAFAEDYFTKNRLYPVLAWENGQRETSLTETNGVYRIETADELRLLSYMVRKGETFQGKTIELAADIDLENILFLPIGGKDEAKSYKFRGIFDGKGYVIRNLNVMEMDLGYGGLFGYATGAVIQNLGIESGTVMGYTRSAAFVACAQSGTVIRNCYNKAMVHADANTGAFVGMVSGADGVLENCYNTGFIDASATNSTTAGLVGYLASDAHNTKLVNCYNVGNYYAFVGSVNTAVTGAVIENCYSVGTVKPVRVPSSLSILSGGQIGADTLRGYASVLGTAYEADVQGINDGYPVLAWENAAHCFHNYELKSDGPDTHSTVCTLCGDTTTEAHAWDEGKLSAAAGCTAEGLMVYTCTVCKEVRNETIAATGHTVVTDPAVAVTCTTDGKTEGSHCSVCQAVIQAQTVIPATGHSYDAGRITTEGTCTTDGIRTYTCQTCGQEKTETIPAKGHTEVTVPGTPATCLNSGTTDHVYCSVCNTVLQTAQVLPRLGHDYSYTDNGDGTHFGTCDRCGKTLTAAHSFTNGTCVCGAKEAVLDESIKIYHTLDLASDISITFAVPKTALASYNSYYMECVLPEYEGNAQIGTSTVQIQPVVSGNYYYFTLTGITAVRMGDMVEAVLHMTKGGAEYISKTDSYSVATYAYAMLTSTTDTKMLSLCADLLRYGAEAQTYKKYRTDALVDAAMTETHRGYLSNTNALSFTVTDSYQGDLTSPAITWVGKTLDLGSKVGMKFVFNAKNYSGNVANLSMKVTYQGSTGETKTVTLTGAEVYSAASGYYSFTFYGLLASELRTIVDVAIFEGEAQLSETIRYSAESYASKTIGTALEPLTRALFAYSDSAKAVFAK